MLSHRPLTFIRVHARQLYHKLRGPLWFPHVPVTLLVLMSAAWLIDATLGLRMPSLFALNMNGQFSVAPSHLPLAVIGGSLLIMAFGLAQRSRFRGRWHCYSSSPPSLIFTSKGPKARLLYLSILF